MANRVLDRLLDDDVIEAAARNMFDSRVIDLDQDGDGDWDDLPDEWQHEWREGARAALEAAVARLALDHDSDGSGS